ncbi:MAG: HAMP domain-containing protein [Hyphomicrobiales bacterium]|nr:HAMP domain-containing protein [Hyphomicrobiales bacterium]MDE2114746.1 HAMP domain-containing protein [Hyphomicrobiales bacterium]
MTAFGKLFRTTAFKLSLVYLVIFGFGSAVVLLAVGWNVEKLVDEQISQTIDAEIKGLSEQYAQGRLPRLLQVIQLRSNQPGSSLYLLTDQAGQPLAGNIAALPPRVIDHPGAVETSYQRPGEFKANNRALARVFALPGGFHLLVGRDLADRQSLETILARTYLTSLIALTAIGALGGLIVARRVLRRVDAMNATASSIMAGDLTQRLPQAGTGDELDRLAINLNSMIERIGELMIGMREVSDNIAHDLRTPLTRLRNHAESALAEDAAGPAQTLALERVIIESDGLIATFNALLLIARAEAGEARDSMTNFDVAEATRASAELYEPLMEEAGVEWQVTASDNLIVHGSRELLGQVIANLIDNALKYGVSPAGEGRPKPRITISAERDNGRAKLAIADHGPGISAADHARVVQRFVRLEGSRSQKGSGLGLALAVAVARLHGGTLTLSDNQPGLKITLELPLAKSF